MTKILIISPHLDDAVLSCGDLINKYVKEGHQVDVLTIFSGSVDENSLSDAAKQFHNNCFFRLQCDDCQKSFYIFLKKALTHKNIDSKINYNIIFFGGFMQDKTRKAITKSTSNEICFNFSGFICCINCSDILRQV